VNKMKKMLIVGLSLLTISSSAFAAQSNAKMSSINTDDMTCAQAQAHIGGTKGQGALLATGPNEFDRYHRVGSSCERQGAIASTAFVKTKDSQSCFVGYTCESSNLD
jgi:hypothetical protein